MTKAFFRAVFTACVAGSFSLAQSPPAPRTATSTPPLPSPIHQVVAYKVVPAAPVKLTVQTFEVSDLTCPPKDSPLSNPGEDSAMKAAYKAYTEFRAEELCKKVRSLVECESWSELGGSGTLDVTPNGKTLVVRNSAAVVERVGKCLESIRQLRDTHVMLEVVVLNAQSDHAAIQALFADKETVPVTAEKMSKLLNELKKEGAAQVLSQPRLMVLNNQTGFFQVGQQMPVRELIAVTGGSSQPISREVPVFRSGFTLRATPKVSADMKSIALKMEVEIATPSTSTVAIGNGQFATAINCQKTEKTICLMDGNMLAMKVFKNKREARTENSFPGLERIPYLNRLFTNVGIVTVREDTIVVVSAKLMFEPPMCSTPMPAEAPIPLMPRVVPQPAPFQPALLVQPAPFAPTPLVAPPIPNRGPLPGDRSMTIELPGGVKVLPAPVPFTSFVPAPVFMGLFKDQSGAVHQPVAPPMPTAPVFIRRIDSDGLERIGVDFSTVPSCGSVPVSGCVTGSGQGEIVRTKEISSLMIAYRAACRAGKKEEAARLALQLLAEDPTCFGLEK